MDYYAYEHKDLRIGYKKEGKRKGTARASPGRLVGTGTHGFHSSATAPGLGEIYFEPGAAVTIFSAAVISGSISAGNPITISSSAMPENLLDPSHPSEKFGRPVR
jgi:hypothetical protein